MKGRMIATLGLFAALTGGQAIAQDLDGSPHDLAGTNANDKGEICVYCHTPHAADTLVEAPLWNKPSTPVTTYTAYDSTTLDGVTLAVGSVSIACLTCHDGSQAVDAVINSPGTGLTGMTAGTVNIGSGVANVGGAAFGGTTADLSNDHPIGIQYAGYAPGGTQIDPDFHNDAGRLEDNGAAGAAKRWWVDTEGTVNNSRDKTDMILYTRENGTGTYEPFVECASCHDPHVGAAADNGTNTGGSDISFMRIANTNSAVCLACHVK